MELEQIDQHIETHLNEQDASGNDKLKGIAAIPALFTAVRPVLKFVRALLFFKPKWQKVLDTFIDAMDGFQVE